MVDDDEVVASDQPLWRRIYEFPLVAMVLGSGIFFIASTIAYTLLAFVPSKDESVRATAEALLNIALLFAAYKLAIRHLGARRKDDLPAQGALSSTAIGLGIGFALFCVAVAIAALLGVYRIEGYGGFDALAVNLASFALLPGFREELLFRGILFRWLEEFGGSWLALAVTAVLFGLLHIANPNATWFSSAAIAVEAGILLGGAYMLTRSLWMAMGLHAAWNFTQGFIFDIPVSGIDEQGVVVARMSGPEWLSGGSFGLEASVIVLVLATGLGITFVWLAIRRGRLVRPMWSPKRGIIPTNKAA